MPGVGVVLPLSAGVSAPRFPHASLLERLVYGDLPGIALAPASDRQEILRAYAYAYAYVAYAVARFEAGADVRTIVAEIGYSHRWLLTAFRDAVGLLPKAYSRVLRMQRVLLAYRERHASWAALAVSCGYSDQAHLTRELHELAGVTPSELERLAPRHLNHVPVRPTSVFFKTRASRGTRVDP